MAKRIVASCDNTAEHGDELVEAGEVILSLGQTPQGLDLCPDCRKRLVGPLEALLDLHGQPLAPGFKLSTKVVSKTPQGPRRSDVKSGAAEAPADWQRCPVPECDYAARKTTLYSHARSAHGETLSVLEGRHGRLLANGQREVLDLVCEVKGCEAAFSDPRGLNVHVRTEHPK